MIHEGMFSSDREDWETPLAFFKLIDEEFGFTLDAAASPSNAKVSDNFYTIEDDSLSLPWDGVVWCNPPYGRGIKDWVRKGYEESLRGSIVVMLIPARTDTAYWHDYVMKASEIRLIRGRLVFGRGEAISNAPFPSALIVFRPGKTVPALSSCGRGALTGRAA